MLRYSPLDDWSTEYQYDQLCVTEQYDHTCKWKLNYRTSTAIMLNVQGVCDNMDIIEEDSMQF